MDQLLQEQKRKAQLNPQDTSILWNYIHLLERTQESTKDGPLYAILTDGEIDGSPCRFSWTGVIPYYEGDDKIVLYGRWMEEYTDDDPQEFFPFITQAWIVTDFVKQAADAASKDAAYGNDSDGDAITSAILSLYKNMAIKIIEFPDDPRCEVDDEGDYHLTSALEDAITDAYLTYRETKDGGRVRTSFNYIYDTMDRLLGGKSGGDKLPYPPRQLLVKHINGGKPFKAILYKQKHFYHLLCDDCKHEPPFLCKIKDDYPTHKLDEHILLEIDEQPIANETEFYNGWLKLTLDKDS